jgi:hypothetical protein
MMSDLCATLLQILDEAVTRPGNRSGGNDLFVDLLGRLSWIWLIVDGGLRFLPATSVVEQSR